MGERREKNKLLRRLALLLALLLCKMKTFVEESKSPNKTPIVIEGMTLQTTTLSIVFFESKSKSWRRWWFIQ